MADNPTSRQKAQARGQNVVLIGMPGVGKSTVGVLLAKAMSYDFLDTDVLIQVRQGRTLQEIIDTDGLEAFCRIEEEQILSLNPANCVVATGGSAIYSEKAMSRLKADGVVVHLDLDLPDLRNRITNLKGRGVVMERGQSLEELYNKRRPLYFRYADLTIDCGGKAQDQVVGEIISNLRR